MHHPTLRHQICSFHQQGQLVLLLEVQPQLEQPQLEQTAVYSTEKIITAVTESGPFNLDRPIWKIWKCELMIEGQMYIIMHAIHNGMAIAASDRSFQNLFRVVGWMVKSKHQKTWLCGPGCTPCNLTNQSAYTSELLGLCRIPSSLQEFLTDHAIAHVKLVIAYDGLLALKQAQAEEATIIPAEVHNNLSVAI